MSDIKNPLISTSNYNEPKVHYVSQPSSTSINSNVDHSVQIDIVDLSYGVHSKDNKVKRLLKNVSLTFKSGTMCALMGPSGAGKRYYFFVYYFFIINSK